MAVVPLREATRAWFAISLQTFGGPAGQIAVMQRTLVDEKRWIGQQRFLFALSYCTLLPGPEATQLATYVGWLLNGIRGALIAGILFILPGVVALLVLSGIYVAYGDSNVVEGVFLGLAPAVLAIVVQAVIRIGRRGLRHPVLISIAVASFVALAAFAVPFPILIAVAALAGWFFGRRYPDLTRPAPDPNDEGPPPLISDDALHHELPSPRRTGTILVVGLILWTAPVAVVALLFGGDGVFVDQGLFFSATALISFGGAYAVLTFVAQQAVEVYGWLAPGEMVRGLALAETTPGPLIMVVQFVAQQAVEVYGWLAPGEMVRGLALAETTPGPLIMVVQFVAFLGAYRDPGGLDPWVAAVLASLVVTWVTFVPSFLFILLGAPYVERLRHNRSLSAALTGITAAVVGVIANLAVYFSLHTLFDRSRVVEAGPLSLDLPVLSELDPLALIVAVLGAVLLFGRGWSVLRTLGVCAVVGLVLHLTLG